ncbi:hypothetical protein PVAP13_2NG296718 [Panicum virgatum]|uniref:Uncharacterized protein n=2 Tax=Panicum virgatum TaxID=38727 RepID=A0A8T0VH56_PANVG|nr:hypothetical protein PVAP13_2NG296718 [Panicum virgatum]
MQHSKIWPSAATTSPISDLQDNRVSVTSVLGGTCDNSGSGMTRRLVLACNIPKDSPMLEAVAERKLVEKLKGLGYMIPIAGEANTSTAQ